MEKTRLIYVLSASHSGSTLLSLLLNVHPEVHTAGELKAVYLGDPLAYRCSCSAPIVDCCFWNSVSEEMATLGHEFRIWDARTHWDGLDSRYVRFLTRPLYRGGMLERLRDAALYFSPTWQAHLPRIMKRSIDLIGVIRKLSGASVIVESSKTALRLKHLLREERLEVHVLRLIRDGRAVALTYVDPYHFADAKDADFRGGGFGKTRHAALDMEQAALVWRRSNEEAELLVRELPSDTVSNVRYEDLCTDPLKTVNSILAKLGLSEVASLEAFKRLPHHVIGNGMRLDKESSIVLDERWRENLDLEQLTQFEKVAGALNHEYGYR